MVGHRVTRALCRDSDSDTTRMWRRAWVWLDDGRCIEFAAWGEGYGCGTVTQIDTIDIINCLWCKADHGPRQIFTKPEPEEGDYLPRRFAYCTDGSHVAWIGSAQYVAARDAVMSREVEPGV